MTEVKENKYKVEAPMGNTMMPNEIMTEIQIREFLPQIVQDPASAEIWKEKAEKDPMEELVEYLVTAGYKIEKID